MKTKTILKTLAVAMLLPAMLLTTACSNSDDAINENPSKKGYELPVTVNVTRQGDGITRATYTDNGNGTGSLGFSEGDQLFVFGSHSTAGIFQGTLTWQSGGTFSGTLTTGDSYDGTAQELLESAGFAGARLLPADYDDYDYFYFDPDTGFLETSDTKAFATSKATAVAQFSLEEAKEYSSGFALKPSNAILNFTISGLTPGSHNVEVFDISGAVTANGSGVATFAVGVDGGTYSEYINLLVDGNYFDDLNLFGGTSTKLVAGKIYNITRGPIPGVLNGQFSVSATKKVNFSKGNLQYQASTETWRFAENQYDYVGDGGTTGGNVTGSNNASISSSYTGWIDLFGWGTGNNPNQTSTSDGDYGTFTDWGVNMGSGWRTLTGGSGGEWYYLFNTRSASTVNGTANARFAKAKVCNVQGVILFPDTYTHPNDVTPPVGVNATGDTGWNGNNYSSADWTKMESAGCVFLPAAGGRTGTEVNDVGSYGLYWSATPEGSGSAFRVYITSGSLNPKSWSSQCNGFSVRLVRDAN